MKNMKSNMLNRYRLLAIISLMLVITFALTSCGGGASPQTVTYTGTAGGKTYTLKIIENTERYAAQSGDAYELTVGTKKSSGKVDKVENGVLTLKSNSEETFKATVLGNNITGFTGSVTWDGESTPTPLPSELTGGSNNNKTYGDFTYTETGNTVTITGYIGTEGSVTIPAQIDGKPVTGIGENAFSSWTDPISVTIPNSVTRIEDRAFIGSKGLTSITIGNGVTSIGIGAFWDCRGLTSVTIPNSVTSIGKMAFGWCPGLTSVTIGNSVTSIGDGAFTGSGLTSVTIPNSVTSIGDSAFAGSGLTSVTIPAGVTSIGSGAFSACTNLTSVTFATGSISDANFGSDAFPADNLGNGGNTLKTAYSTGKAGTYTRPANGTVWTKT